MVHSVCDDEQLREGSSPRLGRPLPRHYNLAREKSLYEEWSLKRNIENWYFLFPDMQILVDGVWHDGMAVPLQHGTIVTCDAALIRHCTAFPTVVNPDTNTAFGMYFGVQKKVAMHLAGETAKEKNKRKDRKCARSSSDHEMTEDKSKSKSRSQSREYCGGFIIDHRTYSDYKGK